MKLKTHKIFSIGVLTVIGLILTAPETIAPEICLTSAIILSIFGNDSIDRNGHEINSMGRPVRTYKTHSFLRGTIYGFLPAVYLFIAVDWISSFLDVRWMILSHPYWILLQGLFVGPTHLFLDVFTEGGIFIKKNGKFQRFALAHIPYDSFLWNSIFKIIGLLILFYGFHFLFYLKGFSIFKIV